ncbi:DUF7281 domain-containing protein [Polaromonas sp. LjRoot131]|uniref:DUF7281 domain-containing protein n=1 Tax=Polaromonas sp. LjRoot131 TaxID=3342262 RepID=UPI003ED0C8F5
MLFTTVQIQFLRRLATERPTQSAGSQVAEFFSSDQGIGVRMGRRYEYSPADHAKAAQLLSNSGLSLLDLPAGSTRAQAVERPGVSEKVGTVGPHADSIAVKTASGLCTHGVEAIATTGYSVLTTEQALRVKADRILVVENFETFRWLARTQWIDYQGLNVMAVYRGDPLYKIDDALRVVAARQEPVWTYFDFDPAGLSMSATMPRLERVILPNTEVLSRTVRKARQLHLYVDQLSQYEVTLDVLRAGPVFDAWKLMRSLRAGISQEWLDTLNLEIK